MRFDSVKPLLVGTAAKSGARKCRICALVGACGVGASGSTSAMRNVVSAMLGSSEMTVNVGRRLASRVYVSERARERMGRTRGREQRARGEREWRAVRVGESDAEQELRVKCGDDVRDEACVLEGSFDRVERVLRNCKSDEGCKSHECAHSA